MLLKVRREAKFRLLVGKFILVFLSIFTKSQASSPFEALNSAQLSRCQREVRPSVKERWRTIAFSRVSTGDSVIPSSCEMKDEPAFKPLQGKPAFFWVRASQGSFHLKQKTQSPSHIPISEGRLLLRCLWKVGWTLQSKTGNHSHSGMIWGARNIPEAALLKLMILSTWDCFLRESFEFPKRSQATSSVCCGSRVCYGATAREIILISIWFWVHWVILLSWCDISFLLVLWQCCWGLSRVKSSKSSLLTCLIGKNAIALDTVQGIQDASRGEGKVSWAFSSCGRNLGYTLDLCLECPFKNGVCSVKSGHLSRYEGQLRNVN